MYPETESKKFLIIYHELQEFTRPMDYFKQANTGPGSYRASLSLVSAMSSLQYIDTLSDF